MSKENNSLKAETVFYNYFRCENPCGKQKVWMEISKKKPIKVDNCPKCKREADAYANVGDSAE